MRSGWRKLTKDEFYRAGGFAHTRQCRKMIGDVWTHWRFP